MTRKIDETEKQTSFWNDSTDAELRELKFKAGLSTRMIAEIMGTTKNAVCGRIHRLGLSDPAASPILGDASRVKSDRARPAKRKSKKKLRYTRPDLLHPDDREKVENGCRHIAIDVRTRPAGMPIEDVFCNVKKRPGSSYCEAHHKACYIPNSSANARKRRKHGTTCNDNAAY